MEQTFQWNQQHVSDGVRYPVVGIIRIPKEKQGSLVSAINELVFGKARAFM